MGMRVLVIGNIFESKSFLVDNFCSKDSEVVANNFISRISGAAIVVSTMAAFLNMEVFLLSKVKKESGVIDILKKLSKIGVNTTLVDTSARESNILLTIYNAESERKCYSYTPNQVTTSDLMTINFSEYDATFFCCIPFIQVESLFEKNITIRNTTSIILASGLTTPYFNNEILKINPNYIFMNRGELYKVFGKDWDDNQEGVDEYISKINPNSATLIVTMGKDGVFIKEDNQKTMISVDTIKNVVHPGGAGDAFSVGFMYGILCGNNYSECCQIGHKCAEKMLSVNSIKEFIDRML